MLNVLVSSLTFFCQLAHYEAGVATKNCMPMLQMGRVNIATSIGYRISLNYFLLVQLLTCEYNTGAGMKRAWVQL